MVVVVLLQSTMVAFYQKKHNKINNWRKYYLEEKDILKLSEKEMQEIRGESISMIFQDPMTNYN